MRSSLDEWLFHLYNKWSAIFTLFPFFLCANIDCVYNCMTLGMSSCLHALSHGPKFFE